MTSVFPSTALRANLSEVKRAADRAATIITDKGNVQYVFVSEEVLAKELRRAAEEAAYAQRMARGIRRARLGIQDGACVVGAEEAIAEAERRRAAHG